MQVRKALINLEESNPKLTKRLNKNKIVALTASLLLQILRNRTTCEMKEQYYNITARGHNFYYRISRHLFAMQ